MIISRLYKNYINEMSHFKYVDILGILTETSTSRSLGASYYTYILKLNI